VQSPKYAKYTVTITQDTHKFKKLHDKNHISNPSVLDIKGLQRSLKLKVHCLKRENKKLEEDNKKTNRRKNG
jgi:hypothetical protein